MARASLGEHRLRARRARYLERCQLGSRLRAHDHLGGWCRLLGALGHAARADRQPLSPAPPTFGHRLGVAAFRPSVSIGRVDRAGAALGRFASDDAVCGVEYAALSVRHSPLLLELFPPSVGSAVWAAGDVRRLVARLSLFERVRLAGTVQCGFVPVHHGARADAARLLTGRRALARTTSAAAPGAGGAERVGSSGFHHSSVDGDDVALGGALACPFRTQRPSTTAFRARFRGDRGLRPEPLLALLLTLGGAARRPRRLCGLGGAEPAASRRPAREAQAAPVLSARRVTDVTRL